MLLSQEQTNNTREERTTKWPQIKQVDGGEAFL